MSFIISQGLLKFLSIECEMPSSHLILCYPLLLLPSVFPSIRVFSTDLALHIRWPKYWSFSFNLSPSNEYSGLISFRIDWFLLGLTGLISLLNSVLSRVFTNTTVQKHQLFGSHPFFYDLTITSAHDYWKNHGFDYMKICWQSNVFAF